MKMLNILQLLNALLENSKQLTARKVAGVVGTIVALSPALGNICRIMARHLHHVINERISLDSFGQVADFSIKELQCWTSLYQIVYLHLFLCMSCLYCRLF